MSIGFVHTDAFGSYLSTTPPPKNYMSPPYMTVRYSRHPLTGMIETQNGMPIIDTSSRPPWRPPRAPALLRGFEPPKPPKRFYILEPKPRPEEEYKSILKKPLPLIDFSKLYQREPEPDNSEPKWLREQNAEFKYKQSIFNAFGFWPKD